MHATLPLLSETDFPKIERGKLQTLQVNLGYRCNQSCLHCHVNAGPNRTEEMDGETMDSVLQFLRISGLQKLDLTGGAPELNPRFRFLVEQARELGMQVIDRCNLTILEEPDQHGLAEFLASQQVEVVASLPCYLAENVDGQRGKGVYEQSVSALQRLNSLGYGQPDSRLQLSLMYNPSGASLPPDQHVLEQDYKRELHAQHGVVFNNLYTLTNMPIKRFGSTLISKGEFHRYMDLLKSAYQEANHATVMCRELISVDWRGMVYDCDFNQMLEIPMLHPGRPGTHIRDLMGVDLKGQSIAVADHCYGCTAGQGSSCGGSLS